ncbi:MAG: PTS ascorbate transporter subunit IIC [Erysipelotrichaceae bacterium]
MDFIINNIFRNPPVLLGLIAAIGLLLQRKNISEVIKGAFMAAFGMVILNAGVNMLIGAILPINSAFQALSGATAVEGLNDVTFTASYGGDIGLAMFFGLGLHLLIARFTPIKTIFLTGHMLWWFPFIFIAAGVEAGLKDVPLIAFGAITSALYWSIMPWVLRKYVWSVTGDESFTLGHPTGCLSLVSGFVAKHLGNKEKSTEDINLPKGLSFFREISITGGAVIFIMFVVVGLLVPASLAKGENVFIMAITQGLNFGAGLIIMLQGVRMLINQIVPAFKGISEKLVPNALPALDCPIIFNYKPNAVLIGFVTAMITSTILVLICNSMNVFNVMLIPLVITSFFECGAAAVIGEGQGGLRGSIIGTVVAAVLMVALVGFSAIIYSGTIQNWMLIFGGNDLSLFGIIAKFIGGLFAGFM